MKYLEALIKLAFLFILAGAGFFYGRQTANLAWLANKTRANITIMDAGAILILYDSIHTSMFQMGKPKSQQVYGWLDTMHLMFPEESIIIPCRIQNGRTK